MDLGCGYGRLLIPLFNSGFENIIGLDSHKPFIDHVLKISPEIKVVLGNMNSLPFLDGSFDKIISMWLTFNHLLFENEQIKTLNEIFRTLK